MTAHVTLELYLNKAGQWSWRMKTANGKIICAPGESFASKAGAKRNAKRVLSVREYAWKTHSANPANPDKPSRRDLARHP